MELVRVDTQRAYELIKDKIITLELAPGQAIHDQQLADTLEIALEPVREALKLLAHDDLVVITPRHGLYVSEVNVPDLEQLSEMRLALEGLCARLAAQRATADDLAVLDALRAEQSTIPPDDSHRLFELDHKFHRALARAAHNKYLARTLDHYFGLSQRLWYLAAPHLDFLSAAVQDHLKLLEAVKTGQAGQAEQIMRDHVQDFYNKVHDLLATAK